MSINIELIANSKSIESILCGKKVLVTGASQGIGKSLALKLAEYGAKVIAFARNEEALKQISSQHSNISMIVGDVSDSSDNLEKLLSPHLPVHYLVNNAGIAILEDFLQIKDSSVSKIFDVNVKGPLILSQIVCKAMKENSICGSIVNVSSQASIRPLENHTVYCASKAALDMITKCMAKELSSYGIRVNLINPTVVMTDMGKANWSDPTKASQLLNQMSVKRFADVDEVISSICFLLSDSSAMTNGHSLPVDGGFTTY